MPAGAKRRYKWDRQVKSDSSARMAVAFDEKHEESEECPDIGAPAILRNPQSRTVPQIQNTLYLETSLANVVTSPSKEHQRLSAP